MIINILKKYAVKTLLMALVCVLPYKSLNAAGLVNPIVVNPVLSTYSISYDYDGGSGDNPTWYTNASLPISLTSATKTGYTFTNYKIEYYCYKGSIQHINPHAAYYTYKYNKYYVTGKNINKNLSDWSVIENDIYSTQWAGANDCDSTITYPQGTIHVKALYTPTTYTITLNPKSGTVSGWRRSGTNYTKTYDIESATFTLPTPTRAGYKFRGWCTDSAATKNCTTSRQIEKGTYGNKTFYAKWEEDQIMFVCGTDVSSITTPVAMANRKYVLKSVPKECSSLTSDQRNKYICGSVDTNSKGGYIVDTNSLVWKSVGDNAPLSGLTFCSPAMLINNQYYHWYRPAQNTESTSSDYQKPQIWTSYSPASQLSSIQNSSSFQTTLKNAVGSSNGTKFFVYNSSTPSQNKLEFNITYFFNKTPSVVVTWGYPITIHCENGVNNNIAWPKNATVRGEVYNALIAGLCDYGNTTGQDAPLYCTTSNTEYILQPDNTPIGGEGVLVSSTNTTTSTGPNGEAVQSYFSGTADCWWKYYCDQAKYLANNKRTCDWCTQNNYCTGGSYPYSTTENHGLTPCPSLFGYSDSPSRDITDCYAYVDFFTGESEYAPVTFRNTKYTHNEESFFPKLVLKAYYPYETTTAQNSCYDLYPSSEYGTYRCKTTTANYYMTSLPTSNNNEISRPGYTFKGWNYCDGINSPNIGECSTTNIISTATYPLTTKQTFLVADWEPIRYFIYYYMRHKDHGANAGSLEYKGNYTIEENVVLDDWEREGYNFMGWCGPYDNTDTIYDWNNECLPNAVTIQPKQSEYEPVAIPAGSMGNKYVWAAYEPITYTIKFDKNAEDATGSRADKTCTYDEPCSIAGANGDTDFNRYGKYFYGWSINPDEGPDNQTSPIYLDTDEVLNLASTQDAEVTLYAIWTDEEYKTCDAGTYYDPTFEPEIPGAKKCRICDKDYWCPGARYLNGDTDPIGKNECPTDYVTADTGAKKREECYKTEQSTCANVTKATPLDPNIEHGTAYYEEDEDETLVSCTKHALTQAAIDANENDADAKCVLNNSDSVCIPKIQCDEHYTLNATETGCEPVQIECDAPGYYLQAGDDTCDTPCETGSYCPGNGTYPYNPTNNQGISECPIVYPESDATSSDIAECYAKIEFSTDGGTPANIDPVKKQYDSARESGYTLGTDMPNDPTKTDHNFDGWYGNDNPADFQNPEIAPLANTTKVESNTILKGSHKLIAKYSLMTCIVNFDANGGNGTIEPVTCTLNEVCALPTTGLSRTNYAMDGWLDTRDSLDEPYNSITLSTCPSAAGITVYAHWTPVCNSNKYLHIGAEESDRMCLYQELSEPTSPKMAVRIDNTTYYANMSLASASNGDKHISKDSTKKMHVMYNDKVYNVWDLTAE